MGSAKQPPMPGKGTVADGGGAVARCEAEGCDAAAEVAARPATRMGAVLSRAAAGTLRGVSGRPFLLLNVDQASAIVPAATGLAMTGLRTAGFLAGPGAPATREALAALAGRMVGTVFHLACGPVDGNTAPGAAGHEPYHAVSDCGWFQLFAKDAQEAADLTLIARRLAEQALVPGLLAQDAPATTEGQQNLLLPERELIAEYLGAPGDTIEAPTAAQRLLFGPERRRLPEWWSVDAPAFSGAAYGPEAAGAALAARLPWFAEPLPRLADAAMEAYGRLTGRTYARAGGYRTEDADYLIVAQGAVVPTAEALADYFRARRKIKLGVVNLTMLRPFPGDLVGRLLKGRKGVVVLERAEQPLAEDPPLLREIRGALGKCQENGAAGRGAQPFPGYDPYGRPEQVPPLFSAAFGLGGAEAEPEALVGAVENLLSQGEGRRRVFLGVDFLRERPRSPKEEIFLQQLGDGCPGLGGLTVRGTENPALLPPKALGLRVEEIAGETAWGAEQNLAPTLFGLAGLHVKGWWTGGHHARAGHTAFHLVAAREPVRAGSPLRTVDMVMATDARVFAHTDPLAGLREGGVLVLQSPLETGGEVCDALPPRTLARIAEKGISVFFLDAAALAEGLAEEPVEQARLRGLVLQGAALAAGPVVAATGLADKNLHRALRDWCHALAEEGQPQGEEAALAALLAGTRALTPVPEGVLAEKTRGRASAEGIQAGTEQKPGGGPGEVPTFLKREAPHSVPVLDPHRLWEQVGIGGPAAGPPLAEPFLSGGVLPAGSALFADLAATREAYPHWLPEPCTGCGECWLVCPDSALPGLVTGIGPLLATLVNRVEADGYAAQHLPRAVRTLETKLRERLAGPEAAGTVGAALHDAIAATLAASPLGDDEKVELATQLAHLESALGGFQLALTEPYFTDLEAAATGSGGLLSVTLDPTKCTGCMACVAACPEAALEPRPQRESVLKVLRRHWELWQHLPDTDARHARGPGSEAEPARALLERATYQAAAGGPGGTAGDGRRTVLHLFAAAVTAAMQPRVAAQVGRVKELTEQLQKHMQLHLTVNVADSALLARAAADMAAGDFTLGQLADKLDPDRSPVDAAWLRRTAGLLADLKALHGAYTGGGKGRAALGMVLAGGAGAEGRFPFNPFPFPATALPPGAGAALALGLFEGQMARMARGFRAIRMTELELEEQYNPTVHDPFFEAFGWRDFNAEEFLLCPPVTLVGGDDGLFGEGWGALSAVLRSGRPVKALCMDSAGSRLLAALASGGERVLPGDGAGFAAPQTPSAGAAGLGVAGTFVAQGGLGDIPHLMESFRAGLDAPLAAVFNVFDGWSALPGEPGYAVGRSRLALESRAHPAFRYDPSRGEAPHQRLSLAGNPEPDAAWVSRPLAHKGEKGAAATTDISLTLADLAATVPGLRHHFRPLRESEAEGWVPLTDYLESDADERAENRPFILGLGAGGRLQRLAVSPALAAAALDRKRQWDTLRSLARLDVVPPDEAALAGNARAEMVETVTRTLMELARGGGDLSETLAGLAQPEAGEAAPAGGNHV